MLVFFVVSDVAPPGFSKFAGNIINLGINTTLSRKLLTSKLDTKIGQTVVINSGQRSIKKREDGTKYVPYGISYLEHSIPISHFCVFDCRSRRFVICDFL